MKARTRFKRALHDLFIKDGISLESGIINEIIYQMAGIELPKEKENYNREGFQFSDWDNSENIEFDVPRLKMPQLLKLLHLFNHPADDYVVNTSIRVNPDFVFNTFLPLFKHHYALLNDSIKKKYVIKSKPILEASAIATLKDYTEKGCDTLLNADNVGLSPNLAQVLLSLLSLKAMVESLTKNPVLYKYVIGARRDFESFLKLADVKTNNVLTKQLELVCEGIDVFTFYNRSESVLANRAFHKKIEEFLNKEFQISATQCDIVENALLRLAQATLGIKGKCRMETGSDQSRIVFNYSDIDSANIAKVIALLQKAGDDTATEGHGYRQYGSTIPERGLEKAMMSMDMDSVRPPREIVESHSIESDGNFFYSKMLPQLIHEIRDFEKNDPVRFQRYRDESKAYLEKKAGEEVAKPFAAALFQAKKQTMAEPAREAQMAYRK